MASRLLRSEKGPDELASRKRIDRPYSGVNAQNPAPGLFECNRDFANSHSAKWSSIKVQPGDQEEELAALRY